MMFIWLIPIGFLCYWLFKENGGNLNGISSNKSSAVDILKERYAKGEIEEKEYKKKLTDLQ